jgi:hypothetical protein
MPRPLRLLYVLLLSFALIQGAGLVIQFAGELLRDLSRTGLFGAGALSALDWGLVWFSSFLAGFFPGFLMRWLAERDWRRAAGWAAAGLLLAAFAEFAGPGFRELAGRMLEPGPVLYWANPVLAVLGCLLGAWTCHRVEDDSRLQSAREFFGSLLAGSR